MHLSLTVSLPNEGIEPITDDIAYELSSKTNGENNVEDVEEIKQSCASFGPRLCVVRDRVRTHT